MYIRLHFPALMAWYPLRQNWWRHWSSQILFNPLSSTHIAHRRLVISHSAQVLCNLFFNVTGNAVSKRQNTEHSFWEWSDDNKQNWKITIYNSCWLLCKEQFGISGCTMMNGMKLLKKYDCLHNVVTVQCWCLIWQITSVRACSTMNTTVTVSIRVC